MALQLSDRPIDARIVTLRGRRVMLSADLAELYGVEPRALVQAVKRNLGRFPADFAFQLTTTEARNLKSQSVISSWGGRRTPPYAFTQEGVTMLSSVLRSPQAVRVNVEIMRAFVRLRAALAEHRNLARRLDELEARYDRQFKGVFDAIRALMAPEQKPRKRIRFRVNGSAGSQGDASGVRPSGRSRSPGRPAPRSD
jgi:hypothetical protein